MAGWMKYRCARSNALGDGIVRPGIGVADDLEGVAIRVLNQRQNRSTDRVIAQVRRNVADAQAPSLIELALLSPCNRCDVIRMALGPAAVAVENALRVLSRLK